VPSLDNLTKGLTPVQKNAFLKLLDSDTPLSAYELGIRNLSTMESLNMKGLVTRVKRLSAGAVFFPHNEIRWKSKYRRKK